MSIETSVLQQELIAAIQIQGELGMTEPQVTQARTLEEAIRAGAAETVDLSIAPFTPIKSARELNRLGAALDAIIVPDELRENIGFSNGMRIGVRTYGEDLGLVTLTTIETSEELMLRRLINLRIFPNIRLAYDVSRGRELNFVTPSQRRRSEHDLKRYGSAAVTRL